MICQGPRWVFQLGQMSRITKTSFISRGILTTLPALLLAACTSNVGFDDSDDNVVNGTGSSCALCHKEQACIACHNTDPSLDGSLGPAFQVLGTTAW